MSTVKELADGLRAFDDKERKWWKVTADEEQYPLVRILTKKAIHELVLHCEKNSSDAGGGIRRSGGVQEHDHGNAKGVVREGVLGLGGGGGAHKGRSANAIPSRSNICRREKEIMK